jgi:hypothetical protein
MNGCLIGQHGFRAELAGGVGSRCAWKSNANPLEALVEQLVCGYVHGCHSTYCPTSPPAV